MKDSVLSFLQRHRIRLPERDADNWRPLPSGTYTHTHLPYGPMRSGITNGLVCYLATLDKTVVHVQLTNLEVELDKIEKPPSLKKPVDPNKPTKRKRKFDPCDLI